MTPDYRQPLPLLPSSFHLLPLLPPFCRHFSHKLGIDNRLCSASYCVIPNMTSLATEGTSGVDALANDIFFHKKNCSKKYSRSLSRLGFSPCPFVVPPVFVCHSRCRFISISIAYFLYIHVQTVSRAEGRVTNRLKGNSLWTELYSMFRTKFFTPRNL